MHLLSASFSNKNKTTTFPGAEIHSTRRKIKQITNSSSLKPF